MFETEARQTSVERHATTFLLRLAIAIELHFDTNYHAAPHPNIFDMASLSSFRSPATYHILRYLHCAPLYMPSY